MFKYAVVEILGKQYLVEPGKELVVGDLGDVKTLTCEKVLLLSNDKLQVGKPYLKESLKFDVVGSKKEKIRVAKFHAKANYRRVVGSKNFFSRIKLAGSEKKSVKKP